MSHTYHDEVTGIRFHYNSDLSGDVEIVFPNNKSLTTHIPGEALSRFALHAMIDPEETLAWLDRMREWLNRHTNVTPGPVPYVKPEIKFEFEVGDRVFLTFSEARGETGTVTELLERFVPIAGKHMPYVDVKLDKDGTQTGPMPVTCVQHRRAEDTG